MGMRTGTATSIATARVQYARSRGEQSSFLVPNKVEQQERKSETPGTIGKFRDLGWQYLCTARWYRRRLMDEDPIREIDKQVHTNVLQGT